jgi:hypothetical protein
MRAAVWPPARLPPCAADEAAVVVAPELDEGADEEPPALTDGTPTAGVETEGVDTDGVETDGVDTDGVETDGVEAGGVFPTGVETEGTDTDGTVTDGTLTDGTVTDGTVTEGTLSALPAGASRHMTPSAAQLRTTAATIGWRMKMLARLRRRGRSMPRLPRGRLANSSMPRLRIAHGFRPRRRPSPMTGAESSCLLPAKLTSSTRNFKFLLHCG